MKPLIGITTGEIINHFHTWSPLIYGQSRTYSDAVVSAGGLPLLIPITESKSTLREMYERLDGVLLTGGNDVDPALYGQVKQPRTQDVSPRRDAQEKALIEWAIEDDKPIFAICRGLQLLNVVAGGTLYQDLISEREGTRDHELSSLEADTEHIAHHLTVEKNSKLHKILQSETVSANTHHHQGIKDTAPSFTVVATSEDGVIEAIEDSSSKFRIGVQCHPESMLVIEPKWFNLFKAFVESSTKV